MSTRPSLLRAGASLLVSSLILLTGCAIESTAPEGNSFVPAVTIQGRMMGGQQPVQGSTIDLYSVGTTGYGSAGTHLATTTSGPGGYYSFSQVTTQTGPSSTLNATYGCPTNSTLLYMTASGGDPTNTGNASNPSIKNA